MSWLGFLVGTIVAFIFVVNPVMKVLQWVLTAYEKHVIKKRGY